MPKFDGKYYAIVDGREGPNIYYTFDEVRGLFLLDPPGDLAVVVDGPSSVEHSYLTPWRSFLTFQEAEQWLASQLSLQNRYTSLAASRFQSESCSSVRGDVSLGTSPLQNVESSGVSSPDTALSSGASSSMWYGSVAPENKHASTSESLMTLSPEQQQVLERVERGHNVFFTGSAGVGKSVLLREIINTLRKRQDTVGITASTGIAAVNIGGSTLHSWAGIGLGEEDAERYIAKFFANKRFNAILKRWKDVDTLIIDEVSMIDGSLFDKLEAIARGVRQNYYPFGGIQLVLSGDFCQLPPVPGRGKDGQQTTPVFAFDALSWDACVGPPVMLTRVFRQKDQDFAGMLNAMRFGQLDWKAEHAFSALSRKVEYMDDIEPTELFPTRNEVENANYHRLARLQTESHPYYAIDTPGYDTYGNLVHKKQMARLLERLVVPREIELKVGAQVMLLKNLIQGELVNGSVGRIVRFESVREAISRHIHSMAYENEADVRKYRERDSLWPVVRFTGGQEIILLPQMFTVHNADGGMEACRRQVPLILSWALSVHKSQGQTLERVKVDLKRIFETGQAYVALSRATRMDSLQVLNFDASKVVAHPRVLEWHFGGSLDTTDLTSNTASPVRPVSTSSAPDVIDSAQSNNEVDEEVAIAWYHGMCQEPYLSSS